MNTVIFQCEVDMATTIAN